MLTLDFLSMCALAFGAYFLGIIIRKTAIPGPGAPALRKQLLLGLPVSLVVVTPLLAVMNSIAGEATSAAISQLATLGIIMEHGMLVNETISKHLERRLATSDARSA